MRKRKVLFLAQQSPASTTLTSPSKQGKKALRPAARRFFKDRRAAHAPHKASPTKPRARAKQSLSRTHPKPYPAKPRGRQQPTQGSEQATRKLAAMREHRARSTRDIRQRAEGRQSAG